LKALTEALLRTALPACAAPATWALALAPAMQACEINTLDRICAFLAQTGHESGSFNHLTENLNYSTAKRICAVWPKRFPTEADAAPCVRNPQRLANVVYANRLGNGTASSGDGHRYRGRGIIQLTGRSNYDAAGKALGLPLVTNPDLLLQAPDAARCAAWFWQSRGLNALADDRTSDDDLEDFKEITRRINGGTVGLQERLALFNAIKAVLR